MIVSNQFADLPLASTDLPIASTAQGKLARKCPDPSRTPTYRPVTLRQQGPFGPTESEACALIFERGRDICCCCCAHDRWTRQHA
jgi:hypothetical protein